MKRLRKLSRATTRSTPPQKPRMQQQQRRTKQPRNKGPRPAVEATDSRAAILVPPKLDWRVYHFRLMGHKRLLTAKLNQLLGQDGERPDYEPMITRCSSLGPDHAAEMTRVEHVATLEWEPGEHDCLKWAKSDIQFDQDNHIMGGTPSVRLSCLVVHVCSLECRAGTGASNQARSRTIR